jgi:hypothetical protein
VIPIDSDSRTPSFGLLKHVDDFDNFGAVRDVPPELISEELISVVRRLDEREELEPYLRLILHDPNETPHGPAEIADIFTHELTIQKLTGLAAFILKGRSFKTVRAQDVAQCTRILCLEGAQQSPFGHGAFQQYSLFENIVASFCQVRDSWRLPLASPIPPV